MDGTDDGVIVDLAADGRQALDAVDLDEDAADGNPKLPPQAEPLPDGGVRFRLRKPVTLMIRKAGVEREEPVPELMLRSLTGADLRAMQAAGENAVYVGLARAAGMGSARFDAIYDRMDAGDCAALIKVLDHFLGDGLKTGR